VNHRNLSAKTRRGSDNRKARFPDSVGGVESILGLAPDLETFTQHFTLVQGFVQAQPGAHAALMSAAHQDPEAITRSIVALGAVLLDIAAGAFRLTPEEMLEKVGEGVARMVSENGSPAY
jgi:hypothetical protein